ncbi:MAG: alpha glucosidase [Alphaproteobacteria bacterium]|nr:alpha glucosidase [Alphaproteobacteria bacterium]
MTNTLNWWKGAVFYQIYPRSFFDSNGDGIGDLPGITQRLEHIAALGVEGVWICPFFTSPMKDFGYDVADYRAVDPLFGTLEDFRNLLGKAHDLGLRVIIDLVLSHTSDQHPWFTDKPEYYVWADAKPDLFGERVPPNNWVSVFGGSAWEWDEARGQYYLHNFLKEQPDLNFHNPDVQDEMLGVVRYWLEFGVDGFRLDVANFYFHDAELRDNPPRDAALGSATQFEGDDPYSAQAHIYDKSRPENLAFLRRLRGLMDEYPGTFTLGELGDDDFFARAAEYTGDGLLNTVYSPQLASGQHKDLTADMIRTPFEDLAEYPDGGWPSWAFSNHDVVRAASRWHADGDGFSHDPRCSKMLIALLGALRGSVFLYQGEELGLPEAKLAYEDLQDPWGKHLWPRWQGRDGCRTPLPWDGAQPYGGFSSGKPWLPMAQTHLPLSVAVQEDDKHSTLHFTRRYLKWRHGQAALRLGDLVFHDTDDVHVLHFTRRYKNEAIACVFNLGNTAQVFAGQALRPYDFFLGDLRADDFEDDGFWDARSFSSSSEG